MELRKKQIKNHIINFFENRTGQFHGYDLFNYITANGLYKNMYMDTMLRYMREMNADGVIHYRQVGRKSESLYEIVNNEHIQL